MKLKNVIWAIVIAFWLINSFFWGALLLRKAYVKEAEWPNGDKIGVGSVAFGEITAPLWAPFYGIGRLTLIGVYKE